LVLSLLAPLRSAGDRLGPGVIGDDFLTPKIGASENQLR
jgi:hypothetical protein